MTKEAFACNSISLEQKNELDIDAFFDTFIMAVLSCREPAKSQEELLLDSTSILRNAIILPAIHDVNQAIPLLNEDNQRREYFSIFE